MKKNENYKTISSDKKEKKMKDITYTITSDFEEVKPRYTMPLFPEGGIRAKVVGMHAIRGDQEFESSLNICYEFELKSNSGEIIKVIQPVYYPGEEVIDFPFIDPDYLSRLNLLMYDLCHYPEQRLGSEGTIMIKTMKLNGEMIRYIDEFIPDIDFDDLDECV